MADVAVVAVLFLVALPRPAIPLIDGDVWWHIRAGEEVLRTGRVPTIDTWTIVGAGMSWTSQDWLSNVLLALGHGLGAWGLTLLSLLFSLVVVAALLLLWRAIGVRDRSVRWLARLVWLVIGLTVAGPVLGVRVQVVDLPLAAACVLVLWHFLSHRRARVLAWLPVISVAWANLHAAWLLIFLLGGAVMVGEMIDRVAGRRPRGTAPLTWREIAWLAVALLAALAVVSLNPNGPALYLYPLEVSSIAAHRDFLAEWSPPALDTLPGRMFAGFVLVGVLPALIFGARHLRSADLLILGGLTIMAASAARFLLVAGPIGAAVIALALGPVIARSRVGRAFGPIASRMSLRPPTPRLALVNVALATILAVVGVAVAVARVSPTAQSAAIAEHMPVAAVDWIIANDPGDRPFNTYSWGGYLGLRRPDRPVYIDGRSDIYGDGPIRAYADAISLRADPASLLDEHGIDHVLFNTHHPFSAWLDSRPEWMRAYSDELASVWVRRR